MQKRPLHNRYQKPAELPPNPARIGEYLADSQVTAGDVRRNGAAALRKSAKYVRALHAIWRQWKADIAAVLSRRLSYTEELEAIVQLRKHWITSLGAPADFDRALRDFFDRLGRVIFASPDPLSAMRVFWEGPPRRGRRAEDNAERNYALAMAVQERVDAGATVEAASAAIGETAHLSEEAMRKIYNQRRLEVLAVQELQATWNVGR